MTDARCAVIFPQEVVLVGDIGGTNCRLVLWKIFPDASLDEILFQKVTPAGAACCLWRVSAYGAWELCKSRDGGFLRPRRGLHSLSGSAHWPGGGAVVILTTGSADLPAAVCTAAAVADFRL